MRQFAQYAFLLICLSACGILPEALEPSPTRSFSAPTLEASPTIIFRNSDEIYGDDNDDGQSDPTAAALPVGAPLPPLQTGNLSETGGFTVQLELNDGSSLNADFYQPSGGNRSSGILLIGETRSAWTSLAGDLLGAGYTALVVEMPNFQRAEDIEVLLTSLSEAGTVDPSRIAIIGAVEGADMALISCAVYEICDAVVLFSPQSRESLLNVLPNFNPRPMMLIVGRNDTESYVTASSLATSFAEGSVFLEQSTGTGTGLLALNSSLNFTIIDWLRTVLN